MSDTAADRRSSGPGARLRQFGPGLVVAAAFIGPGTVTTASVAGADYGFALLWVLLFSVVAAVVLQEMSARLGVVSRAGLGEALTSTFANPVVRTAAVLLVVAAIAVGNAAFQGGNLLGAALGAQAVFGGDTAWWAVLVAVLAATLLATGSYKVVEQTLIWLVAAMGIVFVVTAVMVRPDLGDFFSGFAPRVPSGSMLTVVALLGTTVVPYNLFLHASSVQDKWSRDVPTDRAVREARTDTRLCVGLGGLVTLAILTTAAAAMFGTGRGVETAADMASQLEPLLGAGAKYFFALGLLAAGITSSVTAPLAAAYATAGALGWRSDLGDPRFKLIWAVIIAVGTTFAVMGASPTQAIVFAQAANGLILPVVAVFLLVVMNRRDLLGDHVNTRAGNVVGAVVVLVAVGLGLTTLATAFGVL